ncbi:MAG: flagellar M-ring protein FliF [Verrucomicrobia bacterium]|nr:flagellar M-ring protein FliF [Verrucomicrobiota bacterium]
MKDQILKLLHQLAAIWKELGVNQRVSLVLGAGVVVIGMLGLSLWSTRVDYGLLYGRLDDSEGSKVVSVLDELKIPYRISGGQIHVPSDKVHFLRMKLIERGLPRGEGVGYELFDKSNFGISDFLQRANYVRAVQTELARSIVLMEGVESARVFVVIPENRLLLEAQKKPTASVLLKTRSAGPMPSGTVNSIRYLVANAVEGLQASQVAVMDSRGNTLVTDNDADGAGGLSATQFNMRRQYEQYLAKNAETMLEKVLGPGQAVVRVAAELSFDSGKKEDERYDPEGTVAIKEEVKDKKNDTESGQGSGGVPGVVSNTTTDTNNPSAGNSSKLAEKTTTKTFAVTKTVSTTVQPPGTLKRISAAVFVNARFEGEGTARKVAARSPEEMEKLKRIVQSTIGIQMDPTGTRRDEITLEEMPFNEQHAVELASQLKKEELMQTVTSILRNLGYPALALIALMMFFKTLKKTSVDQIPVGLPYDEELSGQHADGSGWTGKRKPETVTVGVLNKLMKENPENMSLALRNWVNKNKPAE